MNSLNLTLQEDILTLRIEGNYNLDELLRMLQKRFDDPATPPKIALIVDARKSLERLNREQSEHIVATFRNWVNRLICAAYVAPTDFQYGTGRQYTTQAGFYGLKARPFRDLESAKEWIQENINQYHHLDP